MTILPTISELFTGVINSIAAQFGIVIPAGLKQVFNVLAGTWSAQLNVLYKYQGQIQKNTKPDTADPKELGGLLDGWGEIYLERDRYAATQGQYTCSVTGSAGAILAANTTFLSDPGSLNPNYLFILDDNYTLTGSGDVITLRATVAGTIDNLVVGNTLTCTIPLININQQVTVTGITVNAIDQETVEEYRAAILEHIRLSPQGGAVSDYIGWASNVAGVAKVYPLTPSDNPWQVNVYIEADLTDSGGTAPDYNYGIPTSTILSNSTAAIIADPITGIPRKPIGVIFGPSNVGAIPVTVYQVAIAFTGTTGMTDADKGLIAQALQQAIANIRPFIAGADSLANQNDTITINLPVSTMALPEQYMVVVIASQGAQGALFTGCTMTVNGVSETSYTFDNGIIPYLIIDGGAGYGNVTFS